jgi:hypothetical protein
MQKEHDRLASIFRQRLGKSGDSAHKRSLLEIIGLSAALYAYCMASFNAGYFAALPSGYGELFSLSDLLGTNIPVLNYFFFGLFALVAVTFFFFILSISIINDANNSPLSKLKDWIPPPYAVVEPGPPNPKRETRQAIAIAVLMIPLFVMAAVALYVRGTHFRLFASLIVFINAIGIVAALAAIKANKNLGPVIFICSLILILISFYIVGREWLRFQLRDPNGFQAMHSASAGCIDRKILRANSGGFLLFEGALQQVEFRERSDVKMIYVKPGCKGV